MMRITTNKKGLTIMKTKLNGQNVTHIDTDTGEIICQTEGCTEIKDSTLSEEEKAKKEYEETHIMNFNKDKKFVKLYTDGLPILKEHLTPTEFMFTILLAEFVTWEDCILRATSNGNSHVINAKEIAELLNMDYGVVRRLISALKRKGVIGKHETGSILPNADIKANNVYTANPYIFFKGINVNSTVATFYQNSGWQQLLCQDIEVSKR